MRKIEAQLVAAISAGRDFRSGNTTLDNTDHGQIVRLHGNKIAQINGSTLCITSAGWETTTTKSRLNAILSALIPSARIHAKDFTWKLTSNGQTVDFCEVDGQAINF